MAFLTDHGTVFHPEKPAPCRLHHATHEWFEATVAIRAGHQWGWFVFQLCAFNRHHSVSFCGGFGRGIQ
jgi:hypothetical protein